MPSPPGQTVATMDRREIDAQVDAAIAAVAVAKASLENAEAAWPTPCSSTTARRCCSTRARCPVSGSTARRPRAAPAPAQRDLATANLAQAEAALRRSREVQRDTTITAPVTGFIVERNYDPGAIPGDKPVVVVADLRQMKLEAGVSELEAGRLRVGMKARVEAQAKPGETFEGELAAIAPEVDERNRHFRIEVRVPNDGRQLLSGMYATARVVESTQGRRRAAAAGAPSTNRDGKRMVLKVTDGVVTAGGRDRRRERRRQRPDPERPRGRRHRGGRRAAPGDRRRPGSRGRRALIRRSRPHSAERKPCGYPTPPSSVPSSPRCSS